MGYLENWAETILEDLIRDWLLPKGTSIISRRKRTWAGSIISIPALHFAWPDDLGMTSPLWASVLSSKKAGCHPHSPKKKNLFVHWEHTCSTCCSVRLSECLQLIYPGSPLHEQIMLFFTLPCSSCYAILKDLCCFTWGHLSPSRLLVTGWLSSCEMIGVISFRWTTMAYTKQE